MGDPFCRNFSVNKNFVRTKHVSEIMGETALNKKKEHLYAVLPIQHCWCQIQHFLNSFSTKKKVIQHLALFFLAFLNFILARFFFSIFTIFGILIIHRYLLFLEPILHEIQTVNKVFQINESDPTPLLKREITLLIIFLKKKKILDDGNIDVLHDDFENKVLYTCSFRINLKFRL